MRGKSWCAVTRPLLRFNIDRTNIDVLRGTKINAASKRDHAEGIGVRMRIVAGLILETSYAAKDLRVDIDTALTDEREPRSNQESILSDVRRCKNADVMHIALYSKPMHYIHISIDRESLNKSLPVIRRREGESCSYLR